MERENYFLHIRFVNYNRLCFQVPLATTGNKRIGECKNIPIELKALSAAYSRPSNI